MKYAKVNLTKEDLDTDIGARMKEVTRLPKAVFDEATKCLNTVKVKKFEKGELCRYANSIYEVVFSNGTTTKLKTPGERIREFTYTHPDTGVQEKCETNILYCDTDSICLHKLSEQERQL